MTDTSNDTWAQAEMDAAEEADDAPHDDDCECWTCGNERAHDAVIERQLSDDR